jgi:type IV secretory pathway TraG/TraD family ATPase VirD4
MRHEEKNILIGIGCIILFFILHKKYKQKNIIISIFYLPILVLKSLINLIISLIQSKKTAIETDKLAEEDEANYPLGFWLPTKESPFNWGFAINNPFRGVLIIGGAGSGKTHTFIKNIIENAIYKGFSGIIYDYKYPSLTKMAYNIGKSYPLQVKQYIVNFENHQQSHRVNPLHPKYLQNVAFAEEYATTIVNNLMPETIKKPDFWSRSAIALLQSSIWYFKEHHPEHCNLPSIVAFIQQPPKVFLNLLREDDLCAQLVSSILTAFDNNAEGQLSGTVGTLQIALNKINTPEIAYLLSGNDFDLDLNNPNEPKLLCLGNSPQMQETYGPIISLICTVALKMMNQDGKHPSLVLLDEAPTLYIPKLETVPATGRERKISVIYVAQDISQIVDRYGKEKKDTIISNLANQFWGRVSHHETAEYISKLFGKEEVIRRSHTQGQTEGESSRFLEASTNSEGNSNSFTDSIFDKEVLKASEIYKFTPGTFAYIIVDWRKTNVQGVSKFYYNTDFMTYGNEEIKLGEGDIDIMENYKTLQKHIKGILNPEEPQKGKALF